ncbi:MAG TPA: hypothetical protein VD866_17685 [Urbifossiella sp.]|nr:hypothetical protein [Urbifossiella sp.]
MMWAKDGSPITSWGFNVLKVGATRKGKTLSGVADIVAHPEEAAIIFDPHPDSLAMAALTHVEGNVLFVRLSDIDHPLGFALLTPSSHPDPRKREMENQKRAEVFTDILLHRRGSDGLAGTPLMEEWTMAALMLFLYQRTPLPLRLLPYAFSPGTDEFERLVGGCTLGEIKAKFRQYAGMPPRTQRSEAGSTQRLFNAVFRSQAFTAFSGGGFDLPRFLDNKGRLIFEKGEDVSDDAMRVIYGAVSHLVIDYAKARKSPFPRWRIHTDEATNAGLFSPNVEGKALKETSKNGLNFTIYVQDLEFPGGSDGVLQNCLRHEWFGCPLYDLARKAAVDILSGLPATDEARAARLEWLTTDVMNLGPGWRWVREPRGSWKEYVPMLASPWPNWPGLRDAKLKEKLEKTWQRSEYGTPALPWSGAPCTPPSSSSSGSSPPPPPKSPRSSAARRWKFGNDRPPAGS